MSYRAIALSILASLWVSTAAGGPYDAPSSKAATWLIQQRNPVDGSWGSRDDLRYLQTAEAVTALAALNRRTPEYYAGLTWLQNHQAANADHTARRMIALQASGGDISADIPKLQAAQRIPAPANGGFGLSPAYQGATLDSALALQAYAQAGIVTNATNAIAFLKTSQLTGTDSGWALGQESVSDPVATAQVLIALIAYRNSDPSLNTIITNGLTALNAKVGTTSPVIHQALAAIANLRNSSTSSQATTLLNSLTVAQAADGSWGGDPYATALAARAMAAAMATDLAALATPVALPDQKLRTAVNLALGRSSLDGITRGDLANLTTLDISNRGITDLTGLEWATRLTTLIATNNNITSTAPLSGLTQLTQLYLGGNPVGPVAKLSSMTLAFGGQRLTTTSAAQTLTLTNTGGAVLNISSISVSGDYSRTTTCGTTLAAGASCTISPKFAPAGLGNRTGTVAIADDAGGSPQSVALQGVGVACARADFNVDCMSDVLWRQSSTGLNSMWFMNGATITSAVGAGSAPTDWVVQGIGDFDGDGMADILWRQNGTGATTIWFMSGNTVVSDVSPGSAPTDWVIQAIGDFDGDGKADILWRHNSTGLTTIWFMNGATISSSASPGSAPTDWVIQAIGDFDGDGKADILWRQNGTGVVSIWLMDGSTIVSNVGGWSVSTDWVVNAVADFDGDGKADILWQQTGTGATTIWLMNGGTITSFVSGPLVSADWTVQTAGDFNGDGKADLIVRQTSTGNVAIWILDGAGHVSSSGTSTVPTDWILQR